MRDFECDLRFCVNYLIIEKKKVNLILVGVKLEVSDVLFGSCCDQYWSHESVMCLVLFANAD